MTAALDAYARRDVPRVLAFAGNTRRDSFDKRLVQIATAGAHEAGDDVTDLDLWGYRLPVFNQDEEATRGNQIARRPSRRC